LFRTSRKQNPGGQAPVVGTARMYYRFEAHLIRGIDQSMRPVDFGKLALTYRVEAGLKLGPATLEALCLLCHSKTWPWSWRARPAPGQVAAASSSFIVSLPHEHLQTRRGTPPFIAIPALLSLCSCCFAAIRFTAIRTDL